MPSLIAEPLTAIDLMKLYGKLHFSWDLQGDSLNWKGPIEKLFSMNVPILTGTSFLHRLEVENFWSRFRQIYAHLRNGSQAYEARYQVILPAGEPCYIQEHGVVLGDPNGRPAVVEGYIVVCENQEPSINEPQNCSGYDSLTGYPTRDVIVENLTVRLDHTARTVATGGYLSITIDKLNFIFFSYGLDVIVEVIRRIGSELRGATRFNDFIGRSSGCTFGMILDDADEWGILQAAQRLSNISKSIVIKLHNQTLSPTLSVGGVAFREEKNPLTIIGSAERSVFEMQNMKGSGIFAQRDKKVEATIERPKTNVKKGQRRMIDK